MWYENARCRCPLEGDGARVLTPWQNKTVAKTRKFVVPTQTWLRPVFLFREHPQKNGVSVYEVVFQGHQHMAYD